MKETMHTHDIDLQMEVFGGFKAGETTPVSIFLHNLSDSDLKNVEISIGSTISRFTHSHTVSESLIPARSWNRSLTTMVVQSAGQFKIFIKVRYKNDNGQTFEYQEQLWIDSLPGGEESSNSHLRNGKDDIGTLSGNFIEDIHFEEDQVSVSDTLKQPKIFPAIITCPECRQQVNNRPECSFCGTAFSIWPIRESTFQGTTTPDLILCRDCGNRVPRSMCCGICGAVFTLSSFTICRCSFCKWYYPAQISSCPHCRTNQANNSGSGLSLISGDIIADRFKISRKLNERIFITNDLITGRDVALKCLVADRGSIAANLLANEYLLLAAMPAIQGVQQVIGAGYNEKHDMFWMASAYAGRTLAAMLWNEQIVPDDIILQIASILQKLHSLGIVHGDLKPEHICINDEGIVTLIDFGISSLDTSIAQVANKPGDLLSLTFPYTNTEDQNDIFTEFPKEEWLKHLPKWPCQGTNLYYRQVHSGQSETSPAHDFYVLEIICEMIHGWRSSPE